MHKRTWATPVRYLVLTLLVIASLFPIYYVLINSVKTSTEFAQNQLALPTSFQWSNFVRAWDQVARPMLNSTVIVAVSVAGILLLSSLAAFAFAFLQFPGKRILFGLVFGLLLIPGFLTLIPLYLQIRRLPDEISSTYLAVILPYIAGGQAFSIFVLKTFFEGISKELLEAARIDGAGDLRIFRSIALPLSVPVLASVAIINLVPLWNDYLLPNLIIGRDNRALQTISMALVEFQGSPQSQTATQFGALMASYALAAVPLILVFSLLMRYYVEGVTSGAVKS